MTMDKSMTRAVDRITNNIECQTPKEEHFSMNKKPREDDMDDILLYCSEARWVNQMTSISANYIFHSRTSAFGNSQNDEEFDEMCPNLDRGQDTVIGRALFTPKHLIDTRMTSNKLLFEQDNSTANSNTLNNTNESVPIVYGMSQPTMRVKLSWSPDHLLEQQNIHKCTMS